MVQLYQVQTTPPWPRSPRRRPGWRQARIYGRPAQQWRAAPAGDRLASMVGRRGRGPAFLAAAPAGGRLALTAGRRRRGPALLVSLKFTLGLTKVCV